VKNFCSHGLRQVGHLAHDAIMARELPSPVIIAMDNCEMARPASEDVVAGKTQTLVQRATTVTICS
jgi:phosphoenolpyruvate-protein kinase (PTS system EI component)